MTKLVSIGEMLIDFIPTEKGLALEDVPGFTKMPGGAPANVAAAVSKYGQQAKMVTKLGKDAFGDFLVRTLQEAGVDTADVLRTDKANTGLAFVSLKHNGERDFSFYRNPSADLLLEAEELRESIFEEGDYLHFCSVDLVESPMKNAHRRMIELAGANNGVVSFDPNVRLPLWPSPEACREAILEFLPYAHILKVSDEELAFITGIEDESKALQSLFTGSVQVVVYTKGSAGAMLITKQGSYEKEGFTVEAIDTTGAGDAFIGGLLSRLIDAGVSPENLESYVAENSENLLQFANASGALTTTRKGGISALPTLREIGSLIGKY